MDGAGTPATGQTCRLFPVKVAPSGPISRLICRIVSHRDTDALQMAERLIELLLREEDLGAGFRWTVRNREEVGDREQGMDPCVQT